MGEFLSQKEVHISIVWMFMQPGTEVPARQQGTSQER
jgi:hypothetical protein